MIIFAAEVQRRSSLGAVNNDNQPSVKPWSQDTHRNQIRQFGGKMFKLIGVLGALVLLYCMSQDQIPLETCYICASIMLAGYMAGGKE